MVSVKQELASVEREHKVYSILLQAIDESGITDFPVPFLMRAVENVETRPTIVKALAAAQVRYTQVAEGTFVAIVPEYMGAEEMYDLIKLQGFRVAEEFEVNLYNKSQSVLVLEPFPSAREEVFEGRLILCFDSNTSNVFIRDRALFNIEGLGDIRAYRMIATPIVSYEDTIFLLEKILRSHEKIATWLITANYLCSIFSRYTSAKSLVLPAGDGSENVYFWSKISFEEEPHSFNPRKLPRVTVPKDTLILTLIPSK